MIALITSCQRILTKGRITGGVYRENLMWHSSASAADKMIGAVACRSTRCRTCIPTYATALLPFSLVQQKVQCHSAGGVSVHPRLIHSPLGPQKYTTKRHLDRFSCFGQLTRMIQSYSPGGANVHPQQLCGSLGAHESVLCIATRSAQLGWDRQCASPCQITWRSKPLTSHPRQLSLSPSAGPEINTDQSAMKLCDWGAKTGMAQSIYGWTYGWQVKLCDPSLTRAMP